MAVPTHHLPAVAFLKNQFKIQRSEICVLSFCWTMMVAINAREVAVGDDCHFYFDGMVDRLN